jgi:hypothetical protein
VVATGIPAVANARDRNPNGPATVNGVLQVEGVPSSGWTVELYAAGPNGARWMDTTTTDDRGAFRLRTHPRAAEDVVQYVVATRGAADVLLVSLGPAAETPSDIVVNELATIATIWTHAQFIEGSSIAGNPVGLRAAARNVPNLVDLRTGRLGSVVLDTANLQTNTAATMGTLAGLLGRCLTDGCPTLFELSAPPGSDVPTDTLAAFHDIALHPWHNVGPIFRLLPRGTDAATDPGSDNPFFLPTLLYPPTAWTLSLVYTEGGFNAPGGLGIDGDGNVWANNNFMVGSQSVLFDFGHLIVPHPDAYPGVGVTKLASNGAPLSPRTGFLGGGTFGAAFGLAIDQEGNAWVGNFAGNSVTKLAPDGTPISPDSQGYSSSGGYHDSALAAPQATIVTADGSIWLANMTGNTVSQMVGGDPRNFRTWGGPGCAEQLTNPWGLASDAEGKVYVTNLRARSVSVIDPAAPGPLCPVASYPLDDPAFPQGLAVDTLGNVWVADTYGDGEVTFLDAANGYTPTSFKADGAIVGPWSVAIDGADNVWVADFFGRRIHNLCGASGNCPVGMESVGARISPAGDPASGELGNGGGYGANGAVQNITSINIDQAGNVWAANNFNDAQVCLLGEGIPNPTERITTVELEELQTECGGNGAVVMFGVAAPVAAPIIGPPRQP